MFSTVLQMPQMAITEENTAVDSDFFMKLASTLLSQDKDNNKAPQPQKMDCSIDNCNWRHQVLLKKINQNY